MRYEIKEGAKARSSWYVAEDGYIYIKKNSRGSSIYLRCLHERGLKGTQCRATCVINGDDLLVNNEHNHEPAREYLEMAQAYNSLRIKARENGGSLRVADIISQVCREERVTIGFHAAQQVIRRERKLFSNPWKSGEPPVGATSPAARTATVTEFKGEDGEEFAITIVTKGEQELEGALAESDWQDHEPHDSPGDEGEEQQTSEMGLMVLEEAESVEPDLEDLRSSGHLRVREFAAATPSGAKRAAPRKQLAAKRAKMAARSHDERVTKTIDELARRDEDPDRSFLLSLLPYLNNMSESVRSKAKLHLLQHVTECAYPPE